MHDSTVPFFEAVLHAVETHVDAEGAVELPHVFPPVQDILPAAIEMTPDNNIAGQIFAGQSIQLYIPNAQLLAQSVNDIAQLTGPIPLDGIAGQIRSIGPLHLFLPSAQILAPHAQRSQNGSINIGHVQGAASVGNPERQASVDGPAGLALQNVEYHAPLARNLEAQHLPYVPSNRVETQAHAAVRATTSFPNTLVSSPLTESVQAASGAMEGQAQVDFSPPAHQNHAPPTNMLENEHLDHVEGQVHAVEDSSSTRYDAHPINIPGNGGLDDVIYSRDAGPQRAFIDSHSSQRNALPTVIPGNERLSGAVSVTPHSIRSCAPSTGIPGNGHPSGVLSGRVEGRAHPATPPLTSQNVRYHVGGEPPSGELSGLAEGQTHSTRLLESAGGEHLTTRLHGEGNLGARHELSSTNAPPSHQTSSFSSTSATERTSHITS
ncbi:hypothetical protein SCHPADRAFT_766658, partial [Schizopora paradoxa]